MISKIGKNILEIIYTFKKSNFLKKLTLVLFGTIISQIIPILVSPILTRNYSPKDFGNLSIFMSACTLLAVFATGRYDFSILEQRTNKEAKHIVSGALYLALIYNLIILFLLFFGRNIISEIWNFTIPFFWVFAIPISVFALSIISILTYWLNRIKNFRQVSISRIINSLIGAIISLLLINYSNYKGLILGYFLGLCISCLYLLKVLFVEKFTFEKNKIKFLFLKFKQYPLYTMPSTLLSEFSAQIPLLMLGSFFSLSVTGNFTLANRVMIVPTLLVGNAIGEVYRQTASEYYLKHGNCLNLFLNSFKTLFFLGLIPLIIFFFFSNQIFIFVFGPDWNIAGEISKITSFIIFFQLISTPLSYTITFKVFQKYDFLFQMYRTLFSIIAIYVGFLFKSYILALKLYTFVYVSYYISNSILQYIAAKGNYRIVKI